MAHSNKHINTYIHDILSYIKTKEGHVSFTELYTKLNIDVHNNFALLSALRKNEKILIQNNNISYVYTFNIKTEQDLIDVISTNEGIEMNKLKDNCVDITSILEECTKHQRCLVLKDQDGDEVVFYNDTVVERADEEIINLWRDVKVPGYQDLLRELSNAGLKSLKVEVVKRKALLKKGKSKKYKRNIKITNTHVKGLDLGE